MSAGNLHLIIDKSLFQSLPLRAFTPLDRHFTVVIPPILIKEIVGDLARAGGRIPSVQNLANRFGANGIVCPPYDFMVHQSLLGVEIPLDGRILAAGLVPVKSSDGMLGHHIVDTPEDISLRRWQAGNFTTEDAFFAYSWQKIKKYIKSGLYRAKLEAAGMNIETPKNLEDLDHLVNNILEDKTLAGTLLGLLHIEFKPSHDVQVNAINRWHAEKKPLMKDFAPYAEHCLRANLLLALGKLNESILGSHDQHDLRDLEYCYYLPFCEVFASSDTMHKKLIKLLLRANQRFVGAELEADLRRLSDEWVGMTQETKANHHRDNGSRPVQHPNSCVYELWEEMRPERKPNLESLLHAKVTSPSGECKPFGEFLKDIADKITKASTTSQIPLDEGSFLMHTKKVSKEKLRELYPHINFDEVR